MQKSRSVGDRRVNHLLLGADGVVFRLEKLLQLGVSVTATDNLTEIKKLKG